MCLPVQKNEVGVLPSLLDNVCTHTRRHTDSHTHSLNHRQARMYFSPLRFSIRSGRKLHRLVSRLHGSQGRLITRGIIITQSMGSVGHDIANEQQNKRWI